MSGTTTAGQRVKLNGNGLSGGRRTITVTGITGTSRQHRHNAPMKGIAMKRVLVAAVLLFGISLNASADIWKWTDAHGKIHFVNTLKAIYTWVEDGRVFFSDTPDHEDAVSVELVWHSTGNDIETATEDAKQQAAPHAKWAYVGETPEERLEREKAEKYYCKRAQDIYNSYLNAPRLYRTNEAGVREYLSDEDAATTLAETKARVDELCNY